MTEERKDTHDRIKHLFPYVLGTIAFALIFVFILFKFDSLSYVCGEIANAIAPFTSGLIVAFVLNTIVNLFENHIFAPLNRKFSNGKIWNKIQRPITLLISYLTIFALLSVIIFFIIPEFAASCEAFAQTASRTFPGYIDNALKWVDNVVTNMNMDIDMAAVEKTISSFLNMNVIIEHVTSVISQVFPKIISATVNVASGIFAVVMSLIFSAYFLAGKENLIMFCKRVLYAFTSRKTANRVSMFMSVSNNVFSSYIRGQLTECLILGALCYIGMSIIGFDYALLISVIITITALVPVLGAYIGAIMGVIILLMTRPIDAVWFVVFIICLQQFEGNIIYPKVVGSSIGLPGIWTLTAVVVFGSLFGIVGVLVGTPIVAVVYKLVEYYTEVSLEKKAVTDDILNGSEVHEKYHGLLSVHEEEHDDDDDGKDDHSMFKNMKEKINQRLKSGKH